VLPPGDSTPPKPKPSATEGKPGTGAALREALIGQGFDTVFKVAQHKDGAYTAAFDSSIRHTNESAAGSARDYAEQLALAGYHVERAGADIDVTLGFNGYPTPMVRFRTVDETDDGDEWYTPPDILALARELMGGIDVDPASSDYAQRAVQAAAYYTRFTNGLRHPWRGRVWLNPPYSYPLVERFTQKLVEEYERGSVTQAVVLVNNRTDANWCQQLMLAATATCFSAERIGFEHPRLGKPDQNRQGQIFFYFGEQPLPFARLFGHFGAIYGAAVAAALLSTAEHEARAAKASGEAAR
ncbi:MAG: DNA N-6-adenine-methyltransferase, partial [Anaerolineae bacterium]